MPVHGDWKGTRNQCRLRAHADYAGPDSDRLTPLQWMRRGLAALAAAYFAALLAGYFFGAFTVRRHNLESAAFIFVFLALLALPWTTDGTPQARPAVPRPRILATLALAALTLYLGALGVGLLSDDYVLRSWVREGRLFAMGSSFTRPVALALWRIVFLFGGGAGGGGNDGDDRQEHEHCTHTCPPG